MTPETEISPEIIGKNNNAPLSIKKSDFGIFDDRNPFLSCSRVYYAYWEEIPSLKVIRNINDEKALKWLETEMSGSILKKHVRELHYKYDGEFQTDVEAIYILKDNLLVCFGSWYALILFTEEVKKQSDYLLERIKKFVRKKRKVKDIGIFCNSGSGISLVDIENKKPKLQLEKNYNDDLIPFHQKILKELRNDERSGLILFHGAPGTGKTTYIRHLINSLKKRVIFLSPKIAGNLDSPDLIKLLLEHPNSILIIEDAENLISSRDSGGNSGISMLLNLTDGILGESLGIQVICTFNTSITNIDKALLRKGRLIGAYDFKPLTVEKAKVLASELGVQNMIPHRPMTLAEIYHANSTASEIKADRRNVIGFMAHVA